MSSVSCFHNDRSQVNHKDVIISMRLGTVMLGCARSGTKEFDWDKHLNILTSVVFDREITFQDYLNNKDHPWYQYVTEPYTHLFELLKRWSNQDLLTEDKANYRAVLEDLCKECLRIMDILDQKYPIEPRFHIM